MFANNTMNMLRWEKHRCVSYHYPLHLAPYGHQLTPLVERKAGGECCWQFFEWKMVKDLKNVPIGYYWLRGFGSNIGKDLKRFSQCGQHPSGQEPFEQRWAEFLWGVPKIGVPHTIIHFRLGCSRSQKPTSVLEPTLTSWKVPWLPSGNWYVPSVLGEFFGDLSRVNCDKKSPH